MAGMKYLFQSMNVLNGLLTVAVATVAYFTVIPFLNPDIQMSLPAAKETVERSGEKPALPQNYSPVDYAVISEQNLFHPERKIPPEKKDEKAIPRPEVILHGTLIMDDMSIAFIENKKAPYSTPGRGERQIALKKGDNLNGYILREVEANRIVLVKGEDKIVVMLNDGEKRKAGAAPAPQATSTLPSGGSQPAIVPSSLPAAPSLPQAATSPAPGVVVPGRTPTSRREALLMRSKEGQQMRREALRMQQP
ncbi:MAG: hypothetical protein NTW12_14575 [Deltaproteobacteria bacterium]|nr:hypothetical protein [Deltaproteobacteria bacterium]